MVSIHGHVLVRETNSGVPNLVVAAYDSEVAIQDLIAEHPRKNIFAPPFFEKLGKRIGSVLTDANGVFVLSKENLHFDGVESRPDLILLILAPEDIQDMRHPFVLPPEDRVLYISSVPRTDAGNEEVYMIRLLQAQLDHFMIPAGLTTTTGKRNDLESGSLSDSIENTYLFKENLKEKLKERLIGQEKKSQARKEMAQRKTKDFSAIPLNKRDHPLLITDPAQLAVAQHKTMTAGLKKLNARKSRFSISVSAEELKALGAHAKDGKFPKEISTLDIAAFMADKIGGVSLVRKRSSDSTLSAAQILQKYLPQVPQKPAPKEKKNLAKPNSKKNQ